MADSYCMNAVDRMTEIQKAMFSLEPVLEVCDRCNAEIIGWEFPRAILQADGSFKCRSCDETNHKRD